MFVGFLIAVGIVIGLTLGRRVDFAPRAGHGLAIARRPPDRSRF